MRPAASILRSSPASLSGRQNTAGAWKIVSGSDVNFADAELEAKRGFYIREITMPYGCVLQFVPAQPMHRRPAKRVGDFYIRDLRTGANERVTLGEKYRMSEYWEVVDA